MNKHTQSRKGSAMVFVLLIMTVIVTLGIVVNLGSVIESRSSIRISSSTRAFWMAEAGIQRAIWEVNFNNCVGMKNAGTQTTCTTCDNCGTGDKVVEGTLNGGQYQAFLNQATTAVTSWGYHPSMTPPFLKRGIYANVSRKPLFGFGAFSQASLKIENGIKTDSYNSANGAYGGANIGHNGNMGTNGVTVDIIAISNNVTIDGSVSTGAGGTVDMGTNVTITGGAPTHSNNVVLRPVVIPTALSTLPSSGALTVGIGQTQTLAGGDYHYDYLNLQNNTTLNFTGDVRLYLTTDDAIRTMNNVNINILNGGSLKIYTTGTIDVKNGALINNQSKDPSKFIIYSTYQGADGIKFNNNGNLHMAVYAPQTDVDVDNNTNIYGSLVGGTVNLAQNIQLHYDENLKNLSDTNASLMPHDWQEI